MFLFQIDKVLQQGDIGDILELHNKEEKVRFPFQVMKLIINYTFFGVLTECKDFEIRPFLFGNLIKRQPENQKLFYYGELRKACKH